MNSSLQSRLKIVGLTSALAMSFASIAHADQQVNSVDSNSPSLGNNTTESETYVARSGSLVVVGYNTFRQLGLIGAGSFTSLSGYAYSKNGGATFTDAGFVPPGSYILEGDPTLAFDSSGNLYYASLLESPTTGLSYIGVNKSTSTSPAVTFADPIVISGAGSASGGFQDKEFLAVDNTGGPYNGRVYVGWTDFGTGAGQASFAASTSTSPLAFGSTLALTSTSTTLQHGVIPVVAPDGSVYVAWATLSSTAVAASATVNLVKSSNGGASFANPDPSDPNPTKTVASFTSTSGSMETGSISIRTRSFAYLAIDNTPAGSPTRGNMYVVYQAQPGTAATPRSEIMFVASTNSGKTWSTPRNITSGPAATIGADATNNDNWMPAISVSPVTGHIKVLVYSRREDPANQNIRVYETASTDAGMTWYNEPFSSVAFTPSTNYSSAVASGYMGDYQYAFADSSGLFGAWGDTRNLCTPPGGASAPCSPAGRGDQDAWSKTEADATGADLAITPWGYVTGAGPTWQTPDIFVVNAANAQVNAELGVNNQLRVRIRNLGSASASGAVVRVRFAPWYSSIPDSAFELIGTYPVNVAAGATQVLPITWNLTNVADTNGGIWPGPISAFGHFCVRVDIEYPADINLSNNSAQDNFFDVTTSSAPFKPIRFLIGNPLGRAATLQLVTERFSDDDRALVAAPVVSIGDRLLVRKVAKAALAPALAAPRPVSSDVAHIGAMMLPRPAESVTLTKTLAANELRVGTIELTRPPASVTSHLDHDIVANIDTVVDGKIVGGFSVLLARANVPVAMAATPADGPVVSRRIAESVQPLETKPKVFELASSRAPEEVLALVSSYLRARAIPIGQFDPDRGLGSTGAINLTEQELLAAVAPQARALLPRGATGIYFVTFKTEPLARAGVSSSARVAVSVRILVPNPSDPDSPLAGRILPSNGTLEQRYISDLAPLMK